MATRYNYTGGIVTNGLILNLDAAKTDSYPGTGTTWRDLSGNSNNGTLTNGPTFSGIGKQASIVFDGVDDYVSIPLFSFTSDFTVTFFERITGGIIGNNQGVIGNVGSGDDINHFNGYIRMYNRDLNADAIVATSPTNLNIWYNWVFTRSGATYRIYKNGIVDATSTYLIFSWDISAIGSGNAGYFRGNIPSIQIYNRALSAQEVTQNFNALRGRYGI
jgi:hypothetical protein